MKAAFSTWDDRIAPVFDTSEEIRLVEVESGKIVRNEQDTLPNDLPVQKALRLAELKAEVLVCGAISRVMHDLIISYGIRVIPFISGTLDEVVPALISGRRDWSRFSMPGCRGDGRRRPMPGAGVVQAERFMNRISPAGRGIRGGRGDGVRRSQSGGYAPGGGGRKACTVGECVCPQCGHRQIHRRGIPCYESRCPECGTPLIRG